MLQKMPLNILKKHVNADNIDLNNFFGFVKVRVTCPDSVKRPLLPLKHNGKTIFPTGQWEATYFAEELRKAKELIPGYEYTVLSGIEFDKVDLFSDYVNTLYQAKCTAKGAERWIAKQMLNCLYGIFGRSKKTTKVVNIFKRDLINYISNASILKIIPISEEILSLVIDNSPIVKIKDLRPHRTEDEHATINVSAVTEQSHKNALKDLVKNNVAIAAAITSYARIHMMPFKLDPSCAYSDTDSIFTRDINKLLEKLLDNTLLGKFKDELIGDTVNGIIDEATFIGIKQYGYKYINKEGIQIEKSVFAGAPRNSLTYDTIQKLFQGESISLQPPARAPV